MNIALKGITWGHSRGYDPLVAASIAYNALHPSVTIQWDKRSLQEFADFPIEKLTETYDLLIIDHPWVGCAEATNCVLPLNEYLPHTYLQNQLENTVGSSHKSYQYNNQQWALAIDAAAPAASYRADLMQQNNVTVPQSWDDVIALAKKGKVAVPAIPIDLLMNFYTFCIANGEIPFLQKNEIVSNKVAIKALTIMQQLYSNIDAIMFECNPIKVAALMSNTNDYWYCPFAYCYSNYARNNFSANILQYTNVVSFHNNQLQTTIGGTGISVSSFSQNKEAAIDFAQYVTSETIQKTIYVKNGGQPGHKAAWQDEAANKLTNNFFTSCLPVLENSYMRPRYNGYLHFQDEAGLPLQQFLKGKKEMQLTIEEMNMLYRNSLINENIALPI